MKKIVAPFLRTAYNYDTNEASDESGLKCEDPSLTRQEFVEESNINFIAEKFGLTGEMPQVLDLPKYEDFEGIFDFQQAQNAVALAKQQFMTLPAKLRDRFGNTPQRLMEFMDNPDNRAEAEFLGLVQKPEAAAADTNKGEAPSSPPETKPAASTPPKN